MPESIDRVRRGFVFQSGIDQEFVRRFLDRFLLLFARFLFDDLAVTLIQSFTLAALFLDGQGLAGSAGRTPAPPPVQDEFVMIERAVFKDAHAANFYPDPIHVQVSKEQSS